MQNKSPDQLTQSTIQLMPKRDHRLRHHFDQGRMWLDSSDGGLKTACLSYAAFEFRLAIERLGLDYWLQLTQDKHERESLISLGTFSRIQKQIYALAGHQLKINRVFEFSNCVLSLLKIDMQVMAPNLGQLHALWDACSELCHASWNYITATATDKEDIAVKTYITIRDVQTNLEPYIENLIQFMKIPSVDNNLAQKFINGQITKDELETEIRRLGVYAVAEFEDGRPTKFIGEAIPPTDA